MSSGSSTRHRPDGRWEVRGTLQGVRRSVYGATRAQAEARWAVLVERARAGTLEASRVRVGEYLTWWLEHIVEPTFTPQGAYLYRGQVQRYLLPALGRHRLAELGPVEIQALYTQLRRRRHLAPSSLRLLHAILSSALNYAADQLELIPRNPTRRVRAPQVPARPPATLEPAEAIHLLRTVRGEPMEPFWWVALCTGLRQGELARLRWRDVDLGRHTLSVPRAKTPSGRRLVHLVAPAAAQLGAYHRGHRGLADALVFPNPQGHPWTRQALGERWHQTLERAGLPAIRFHDIRHTAASLLLYLGVHPRHVQEFLGHANIRVTIDTYSHLLPAAHRQEIERLGTLLMGEGDGLFEARRGNDDRAGAEREDEGVGPQELPDVSS